LQFDLRVRRVSRFKRTLFIPPDRKGFYENLGWKYMTTELDQSKEVVVMTIELDNKCK